MKCLNCGKECSNYLCSDCQTPEILDKVFNEIRFYKPETCENPYILEYAGSLTEKYAERDCLPQILDLFNEDINAYYYCKYYRMRRDPVFESKAVEYINAHSLSDTNTQQVLNDLLDSYLRNDYIKPRKWCDIVFATENLCCELYANAAQYYSMIGEYDLSDEAANKALGYCNNNTAVFLYYSVENMIARLEKQKDETKRYRTKKPYWPATEERRRAVAMFYDEKGITYPRIENKPPKTPENEFAPINECFDDEIADYCAFWCAEAFSVSAAKSIYQIAAVKVKDGKIVDEYQSYIRPWDGSIGRKAAAKEANVALDVIECADDVDIVLPKFFAFVGDDTLVSTGALGNQAKLISRAARYAGMKEIKNEFFDLLDLAADTDSKFDLANNTREYLLSHFSIDEGSDSLDKARINVLLYQKLSEYGE